MVEQRERWLSERVRTKGHVRANVQPAPPPPHTHSSEASSSLTSIGFVISSTYSNLEKSGEIAFPDFQSGRNLFFCLEILVPASLRFQPVLPQNPHGSMILGVELSGYLCYYSLPHMNSQKLPWKIWLLGDCGIQQLCMWHALHIPCRDEAAICEKFFYLECHWAAGTRNS